MGINMEDLSATPGLSVLPERRVSQIGSDTRGEHCDDQYCLEMFRRATVYHDQQAWEQLQQRFYDVVRGWMRRHPRREVASRFDSEDNYVAQAFERFWQATAYNRELEFTSLAAALSYLRASLNGAIMDTLRMYSRPREAPLLDPGYPGEPTADEPDDEGDELWETLQSLLPHERERRLAYLLFHCGLKPREVVRYCSQEFCDVREVYRLRRNIIERLMRNIDQIRWRLGTHEL
jgi:hypothetical protein